MVRPGVNVIDREVDWKENYRCPDIVVFLPNTQALHRDTHWLGGLDFAVEVVSSGDKTQQKLSFYERVNTRELLIVERAPWQLGIYRLKDRSLTQSAVATLENSAVLSCELIPFRFQLVSGPKRPAIRIIHTATGQEWLV